MDKAEKLTYCNGCHQDFYNHRDGMEKCWSLKTAKVVRRTMVGTWQNPPYQWKPQATLSCHTAPDGMTWIDRDDVRLADNQEVNDGD